MTKDLKRQALEYTLGQQLTSYKTEIVYAQTDYYFYCSTTMTSCLEGAHTVLKRQIRDSSKDLTRVQEATKLAINDQLNKIRIKNTQKLHLTPISLSGQFYY